METDTGQARFDAIVLAVPPSSAEDLLPDGALHDVALWVATTGQFSDYQPASDPRSNSAAEPFIAAVDS